MPIIYDVETYPNIFTLAAVGAETDNSAIFEISPWRDDRAPLMAWLNYLIANKIEMVGFNNFNFDYPVIHLFMQNPATATALLLYEKAMSIINSGDRWGHVIYRPWIPQLDLFKIHHFDNVAKSTSLKALQFNMRAESVEDLPIPPGTVLTADEVPLLRGYNLHDALETKRFYLHSLGQIAFRRALSEKYNHDFMNHNDTKIGKDYIAMRLEEDCPGSCFRYDDNGRRRPNQTHRSEIRLADIILPIVRFDHPEFRRILEYFNGQTIYTTKGVFTDISCTINGFTFNFGTGGIHGSVSRRHVRSDAEHVIIDLDVTSYYPSIAIVNKLHPAHLGELFCKIYLDVFNQRKQYKKGTPENAMLKLALNGTYGDSNNPYSPFFDSQYTMSITVNGQLLLCMLAEKLIATVPGLEMIQINTDGLTIRIPRSMEWIVKDVAAWWENQTGMGLEDAHYSHMFIRDVNNYLAVSTSGKVKQKGAYDSRLAGKRPDVSGGTGWHMDTSALVVPMAVEAHLIRGDNIETFIRNHSDPFDFMLRAKAQRGAELRYGDEPQQRTTRYYLAVNGKPLTKVTPPPDNMPIGQYKRANGVAMRDYVAWHNEWGNTWNPDVHTKNKSVYKDRVTAVQAGWNVGICNRATDFDWSNLAYDWYIAEAKKLIDT